MSGFCGVEIVKVCLGGCSLTLHCQASSKAGLGPSSKVILPQIWEYYYSLIHRGELVYCL